MYKHDIVIAPKIDAFLKHINELGYRIISVTSHYVPETNVLSYSIFYFTKTDEHE